MNTLLKTKEELEGKTIDHIDLVEGYGSTIDIYTTDGGVMRIEVSGHWDRCGDYDGTEIEICSNPGYHDKLSLGLVSDEEIEIENKKREDERKKREAEEKRKADEAAQKMRNSELALLEQLKNKYER